MLTVGRETVLSLNVSVGAGYNHTVSGALTCEGVPVSGRQVEVKVNWTSVANVTTLADGSYSVTLNLKAVEDKPTNYHIETAFYGDNALNLTALDTLPNGTVYTVCTTLQYTTYKPAASVTTLAVDPQTTAATTQKKTSEQMQQEAQQDGWFTVWHEFSWWYPWYRVHIQTNVNPRIHIGFNPVLPGGEIADWERLEVFGMVVAEVVQEIIVDVIGLFAGYFAAKVLSVWNPAVGIIAEAVKGALQFALLVAYEWNDKMGLLVSSIVSFIMGFIALNVEIGKAFIQVLYHSISGAASAALTDLHWKLLHVIFVAQFTGRWWLDYVDAAINWIIGGIALIRYLTMG
jgi:hypothetical protein